MERMHRYHTLVVIDKTSTLNQGQLDFISTNVLRRKFHMEPT